MNLREDDTTTVTATGPAQLLSAVPYLLGFRPHRSLVVLCLEAATSRVRTAMRIDLPDPPWHQMLADEVAVRIARDGPGSVVLLCYDDVPGRPVPGAAGTDGGDPGAVGPGAVGSGAVGSGAGDRGLPRQDLVDAIGARLDGGPADLLDAILVRDGRWWSYLCSDPFCCPPGGAEAPGPDDDLADLLAAENAVAGRRTLTSRGELAADVAGPDGPAFRTASEAFAASAGQLAGVAEAGGPDAITATTMATLDAAAARYLDHGGDITDDDVARICLGLADPGTRAAALSDPIVDDPGWLALLVELARRAPDDHAAAVCAMLAWAAAERGDGALANVALDRALAADPAHLLALQLRCGLDAQLRPGALRALRSRMAGMMPWSFPPDPDGVS